MKKLLQLSASHNRGAIGKIIEQIGVKAKDDLGFESWVIYGRYNCTSELKCIKMGNMLEVIEHYVENRLFDNEGLASRCMTKKIVAKLKEIQPDIVHLHNIHDHWLNYEILFRYLKETDIKVIWTFHDCWAYTGHCFHFVTVNCDKWKIECSNCVQGNRFWDRSKRNFNLKKKTFLSCKNLYITTVSQWLKNITEESFFKGCDIYAIPNGLDINVFKPLANPKNIWGLPVNKKIVMGIATSWYEDKGLSDYYQLAEKLGDDYQIVLVGMTKKQIAALPQGIIGLPKTASQEELAWLYNLANVIVSMSKAETFGLTIAEGMACGTPGVVYDNTAHPELISYDTGMIVETSNISAFKNAIEKICCRNKAFYKKTCRKRAEERFDKNICFDQYLKLYEQVLAE
ncbi:glycosyltransferase [uncultured Bacteroides sp.]|uniref:glycosyltransferase n=1 Tax=uncultured Bacteroides sp. TaxID=162156 RepID=UPI0026258CD8|nr:glycosyltransferase [uncultured Bacteroides sp.]